MLLERKHLIVLIVTLLIYTNPILSQQGDNIEFGEVKPTPVLKSNPQDVATVLVADFNNRAAHGRFINIKPEIGLLKSTARTFIQDGIKTEYVTKVIGTTIDNGQYVQLLTTASRVLYNSDNQQTKTVNFNAIDGNDDASFLNSPPSSPFLSNVDYIVPNNPYLVFPARNSRNNNDVANNNNYLSVNDNDNEESEIKIKAEKLVEKASQVPQPDKVVPEGNLPTYTVSHDGPIFKAHAPQINSAPRVGKVITYEDELKAESAPKVLPSVTYFGFADFTTTVGDTIIIFSPSTAKPQIDKDHITSIKGEPTLSIKPTSTKQQHIELESAEPSKPLHEEPRFTPKIVETALPTLPTSPPPTTIAAKEETTLKEKHSETTTEEIQTTTDKSEEIEEEEEDDTTVEPLTVKPIIRIVGVTTPEAIESSQVAPVTTPKYSKPSEEDVLRILASIAANKAEEVKSSSIIETSPILNENAETRVLTGSSIIFFDDDEFDITTQKTQIVTLPSTTTTTQETTTENEDEIDDTTTNNPIEDVKPLTPKPESENGGIKKECMSTVTKTVNLLTTFFVPVDDEVTTTSIQTNRQALTMVVPAVCDEIKPTAVTESPIQTVRVTTENELFEEETTEKLADEINTKKTDAIETTTMEIVTESSTIEEETTVENLEDEEDIEVIYKTLYTTYTYLTTFFQESTSTVSSRKEVVTNIITSTINANDFASLLNQLEPSKVADEIEPTQVLDVGIGRPTEKFVLPENDFIGVNQLLEGEKVDYTPALSDDDISNEIKTLYTTYTYFTTLFNEGKTEIATRTEVYTNFINPSSSLSNVLQRDVLETKFINDEKDNNSLNPEESNKEAKNLKFEGVVDENDLKYSTMIRNATELQSSDYDNVKTSTSDGERSYVENIDRRHYNLEVEDQISSESNIEEGIPSPTLLLQTRYTTFTYYTTVYAGGSSSNVLSRLETLTNVVTETLSPTQVQKLDDATVPVTYFTTFTYWTTFYKDGQTETTSREETVSNVITPSESPSVDVVSVLPTHVVGAVLSSDAAELLVQPIQSEKKEEEKIVSSSVEKIEATKVEAKDGEPSTFFTTYTYYTTNYVGDDTVIDSRFETESNIVASSALPEQKAGARAIDITSEGGKGGNSFATEDDKKGEKKNKKKVALIEATPALENVQMPTGVVSINHGRVIDAQGISTTHFTTKGIGTYLNGVYAEVIETSTSIEIDEIRKAIQPTEIEGAPRHHKTGLVRLIDGTIINKNATTTLYESKIIGTFIEGRYAQVIESTSSIILAKQIEPSAVDVRVNIEPTAAHGKVVTPSSHLINPSSAVLEGSISETLANAGGEGDDDESDDENDQKASLPFQSRKKNFTPVIRPFASRPRPSFNPKQRKSNGPAIITPTEITPTIKATAVKSAESSRNRFAGGRRSSSALTSAFNPSSSAAPSSRRTFGRPTSSRPVIQPSSSVRPSKPLSSVKIQPTSALGARRPLVRSSLAITNRPPNSIIPSAPRGRIRPSSLDKSIVQPSVTTPQSDDLETTLVTEEPNDDVESESQEPVTTTTENSRRNNNPLLRVRRPPFNARQSQPVTTQKTVTITTRRNPLARTSRVTTLATTTTTTERTTRNRPLFRPSLPPVSISQPRQRPSNLFPPRRTTTLAPQTIEEPAEENNAEEDYNDYEETKIKEVKAPLRSRGNSRSKRQALDYGTRSPNYNPRFKRPNPNRNSRADFYTYDSDELIVTEPPKTRATSRYTNQRQRGSTNYDTANESSKTRIKPTSSSSQNQNRLLFTLRKEDTSPAVTQRPSTFRRPQPPATNYNSNRRTTTTTRSTGKYRHYQDPKLSNSRSTNSNTNSRSRTNNRGRGTTSRSRAREDTYNLVAPKNDGTITVTHHIPTEVTIPVVVGKNTEYKMIITAKPSTEILGPKQYSTSIGNNGVSTLVLLEEKTAVNQNGQTEVTTFYLSETPTTSITFTPTTIRGRKTSFSHVVPSTVYDAIPVVSTIQPQTIPNNAPLANILLSQLLLNGFNQQQNQQLFNPLLGLNAQISQVVPQMPATPITEFKTRTTTYVTTIHEGKSTVLPVTFRGMKIYTTVHDEQSTVITATEFITDTVVITPTQTQPQVQQFNSLLLQSLLLNQQQQQQVNPLQNINILPNSFDILKREELENIPLGDDKLIQSVTKDEIQQNSKEEDYEDEKVEVKPAKKPKNNFKPHFEKKLDTSVVTLYISGRKPGDFSTVLSTVINESPVYKRSAPYIDVKPSSLPNLDELEAEASDNYYEYILAGSNAIDPEQREDTFRETESLDSYNQFTSKIY